MRVLVVDDSEERTALLHAALTAAGHEISASQPDVVVLDAASFDEYQKLRIELAEANQKLSDRKCIERAKGLLMKKSGLPEDEAFHALRKLAMSRNARLGEVAQQLIDSAELLGKA